MEDCRDARIARGSQGGRVGADGHRQREQLIARAEVGPLEPRDVLRIARKRARPSRVGVDGADAEFCRPLMHASLCSGEWLICAMSTIVVAPMSIMASAVINSPMCTSEGA